MSFYNKKNIIKSIIFIDLIILIQKIFFYPLKLNPFYLSDNKPILLIDTNNKETLINGRIFLDKCLNFSYNHSYNFIQQPKVSVIIPLYNCEKTIGAAINSIQFQNLSEMEIILINDFSKDNTSKIIKIFQQNDNRIKIINNKKNMGTLYSRSIAVLITKGEYIFGLDNDDMYFNNDIFDCIYKKGKTENLDIIGFLTVNIWNYTAEIIEMKNIYTYQYKNELLIEQPELRIWMINFKNKYIVHNNMIWDKCIKSSIYKKAVNQFGIQRFSTFLSWAEDTSINFLIFNIAKSFKYIHKYGVAHFKGNYTASKSQSFNSKIFGEIFLLDILFDFSKNNTVDKNLIVGQAFYIHKRYNIIKINKTNIYYLKSVLNKLYNCKYINKLNKRKIKKMFKMILAY